MIKLLGAVERSQPAQSDQSRMAALRQYDFPIFGALVLIADDQQI
ncbi:MAG: hypothetical protein OSA97_07240 [Nevskia sp.]|nr:hypothetical protein [Nevskia sp.]